MGFRKFLNNTKISTEFPYRKYNIAGDKKSRKGKCVLPHHVFSNLLSRFRTNFNRVFHVSGPGLTNMRGDISENVKGGAIPRGRRFCKDVADTGPGPQMYCVRQDSSIIIPLVNLHIFLSGIISITSLRCNSSDQFVLFFSFIRIRRLRSCRDTSTSLSGSQACSETYNLLKFHGYLDCG